MHVLHVLSFAVQTGHFGLASTTISGSKCHQPNFLYIMDLILLTGIRTVFMIFYNRSLSGYVFYRPTIDNHPFVGYIYKQIA